MGDGKRGKLVDRTHDLRIPYFLDLAPGEH